MLKQELGKYDYRLTEIKQHQMAQDSEVETKYKLENQRLQQQVIELSDQLNQFDASKRIENERNYKDRSVFQDEITRLNENLTFSHKTNENMKSKITELTSDCQTMQRVNALLEENHEKLKQELNEKNDELKHIISE